MLVETKEINGMLVSKKVKYVEDPIEGDKAIKKHNKDMLTVTDVDGEFEADTVSINYFAAVLALANSKYNQAVASGVAPADAYAAVYQTNTIPWKLKDNTVKNISVEKFITLLENSMNGVAAIVGAA